MVRQGRCSYTSQGAGVVIVVQLVLSTAGQYHVGGLHRSETTNLHITAVFPASTKDSSFSTIV